MSSLLLLLWSLLLPPLAAAASIGTLSRSCLVVCIIKATLSPKLFPHTVHLMCSGGEGQVSREGREGEVRVRNRGELVVGIGEGYED